MHSLAQRTPPKKRQYNIEGTHALIVEDMPVMAKLLGRTLSKLGISHEHVTNGEQALEAVESGQFDMIFMDIMMPGIGGVETTKRIRAYERRYRRTAIPIIAATSRVSAEDSQLYLEAGMDDCIKKPVERVTLEVLLARHLTGKEPELSLLSDYTDVTDEMEAINWDTFREYNTVLKDGMTGLIEDYLVAAPTLLDQMGGAIQERDFKRVHMFASQIKSASVTFGAEKLAHFAAKIEIHAGKGRTRKLDALFFDLRTAYEHTKHALQKKLILLKNF